MAKDQLSLLLLHKHCVHKPLCPVDHIFLCVQSKLVQFPKDLSGAQDCPMAQGKKCTTSLAEV